MGRSGLFVLTLGLLASAAVGAPMQDPASVTQLQADYRDAQARVRTLEADADFAKAAVEDLRNQPAPVVGADAPELARQRARLASLSAREALLAADVTDLRVQEARLLSGLQMMSREPPPPLLVPAGEALNTVRASILLKAAAPELRARVEALSDREADLVAQRRAAALEAEALFTADSARGDYRADRESRLARLEASAARAEAAARSARRDLEALATRLKALGATLPVEVTDAASNALPAGRRRLDLPVQGEPTARFGQGSTGWRWQGNRVVASAPAQARVAYAGELAGWDQVVVLDLGPGWRAVVAGLDELAVETGQSVQAGQRLGAGGDTGEVLFELRHDERPVDPAAWLE